MYISFGSEPTASYSTMFLLGSNRSEIVEWLPTETVEGLSLSPSLYISSKDSDLKQIWENKAVSVIFIIFLSVQMTKKRNFP